MQDLRKQLLKAGLIDRNTKKQADLKARTERRKKGPEQLAREESARRDAFEARRAEQQAADRRREEQRREEQRRVSERRELRDILRRGDIREGRGGPRRFYFVTAAGKIPYLLLHEPLAQRLEQGWAAIVQVPTADTEQFVIVARELAERARQADPEMVRFFNA